MVVLINKLAVLYFTIFFCYYFVIIFLSIYSAVISKIFILTYFNILDSEAECLDSYIVEYSFFSVNPHI